MTSVIINVTTNGQSFFLTQATHASVLCVELLAVANITPGAVCFVGRPPAINLIIPQIQDTRTTLFLPGNLNYGQVIATSILAFNETYYLNRIEATVLSGELANRNVTIIIKDGSGVNVIFTPGTVCTIKLTLK